MRYYLLYIYASCCLLQMRQKCVPVSPKRLFHSPYCQSVHAHNANIERQINILKVDSVNFRDNCPLCPLFSTVSSLYFYLTQFMAVYVILFVLNNWNTLSNHVKLIFHIYKGFIKFNFLRINYFRFIYMRRVCVCYVYCIVLSYACCITIISFK